MSIFNRLKNAVAEEIGGIENVIHHPIYPVPWYLAEVDPEKLYRGSWPEGKHLETLKVVGIKSSINLCSERNQDKELVQLGIIPYNIPIIDNTVPTSENMEHLITILGMCDFPTFIHCEQGIGRTGCMVAAYRVLVNGWPVETALAEAKHFGLNLSNQIVFIKNLHA